MIGVWAHRHDYHWPHTACGDQPPALRVHASVDNFMTNYIYEAAASRTSAFLNDEWGRWKC